MWRLAGLDRQEATEKDAMMNMIEQRWNDGYLTGWRDQSVRSNPPTPTVPAFPGGIPPDHSDPGQYAYDSGYAAGVRARLLVQAGIP